MQQEERRGQKGTTVRVKGFGNVYKKDLRVLPQKIYIISYFYIFHSEALHSFSAESPISLMQLCAFSSLYSVSPRGQVCVRCTGLKRLQGGEHVTLLTWSLLRSTVSVFPPGFAAFQNCFWAE